MDGRVALLGRPRIDARDRPAQLAGRKPWGLLAYLCLEPSATRQELAALLFSAADDPLAALRWSLLQVRRALSGLADVAEEQEIHQHPRILRKPTSWYWSRPTERSTS
jgi:DNA-binding SARP family transcriptional activator